MNSFDFNGDVVAIIGRNGSGKTNLLDAIYYLCFTKSYFHNKEILNIMSGKEGFRIEGRFRTSMNAETENITIVYKDQKKSIHHNDLVYEKLAEHIGKYHAVMIAPDDLKIINEGGEYRRKFFDGIISQSDENYLSNLLQYQKILAQKNAYLKNYKQQADVNILNFYNDQLLSFGQYLLNLRASYTGKIIPFINETYNSICTSQETIHISYQPNVSSAEFAMRQSQLLRTEMEAGRTLCGPHLDDWLITVNQLPAKAQSSQGQKKSILLSLKLAQAALLLGQGKKIILLLDDVFEKLDQHRLRELFSTIRSMNFSQIFVTHTSQTDIEHFIKPQFHTLEIINLS